VNQQLFALLRHID